MSIILNEIGGSKMSRNRLFQMGGLVAVIALVVAGATFAALTKAQASAGDGITLPTWPELTMVYQTGGINFGVGDNPAVTARETRQLDYVSGTHWTNRFLKLRPS